MTLKMSISNELCYRAVKTTRGPWGCQLWGCHVRRQGQDVLEFQARQSQNKNKSKPKKLFSGKSRWPKRLYVKVR